METLEQEAAELRKNDPDSYAHVVLSHGFIEYIRKERVDVRDTDMLRQVYLNWVRNYESSQEMIELGWKKFLND